MTALDDLQCHFTWITEDNCRDIDIAKLILDLSSYGEESKSIKRLSFAAFLRTLLPDADLEKALEDTETMILMCQDPDLDEDDCHRRGFELIALSIKAHIQHMLGNERGKEETLEKILKLKAEDVSISKKKEENEDEESDAIDGVQNVSMMTQERKNKIFQACNAGVQAYALHRLAWNQESLVLFRKAEELDPEYYTWPLGIATSAGQLQRRLKFMGEKDKRILNDLDTEQEESLIRATKLTQDKNPLALSKLGEVYFYRGRGDPRNPQTQNKDLMKKAEKLFLQSYEITPDSPHNLVRLAKVLIEIDREKHKRFAEECLMKAYDILPSNTTVLHRIGQFYEHADSLRDLKKAKEFYMKAITSAAKRNVLAEIDSVRVSAKLDRNYDHVKHLHHLLEVYPLEHDQKIIKDQLKRVQKNQKYRK